MRRCVKGAAEAMWHCLEDGFDRFYWSHFFTFSLILFVIVVIYREVKALAVGCPPKQRHLARGLRPWQLHR